MPAVYKILLQKKMKDILSYIATELWQPGAVTFISVLILATLQHCPFIDYESGILIHINQIW